MMIKEPNMTEKEGKRVGIVGATGAVGKEMVRILFERKFPVKELHLFASARSAGSTLDTPYGQKQIQLFSVEKARKMDILFLAVSGEFSKKNSDILSATNGPIIIDNSSAFRLSPEHPLVVPEINGDSMIECTGIKSKIIANPNCTTAIAAMVLWPLHCKYRIKKIIVSTYQAASGAGAEGMDELLEGTKDYLNGKRAENKIFTYPLPFNVIPHIDTFQTNGYTREEMKVVWEMQKIFNDSSIKVSCTAVRIPTFRAHAEAITIETELPIDPCVARAILSGATGVDVVDDPSKQMYPMPLQASNKNNVEVGRIRQNLVYGKYGLDLFVCGDQLLRGAALNAVLIAEYLEAPFDKQFSPSRSHPLLNNWAVGFLKYKTIWKSQKYCTVVGCQVLTVVGIVVGTALILQKHR